MVDPAFDPDAFDVLTFDCYGTLVDWQGGIVDYLQPVLTRHDAHVTDDFILEFFSAAEPALQRRGPERGSGSVRRATGVFADAGRT